MLSLSLPGLNTGCDTQTCVKHGSPLCRAAHGIQHPARVPGRSWYLGNTWGVLTRVCACSTVPAPAGRASTGHANMGMLYAIAVCSLISNVCHVYPDFDGPITSKEQCLRVATAYQNIHDRCARGGLGGVPCEPNKLPRSETYTCVQMPAPPDWEPVGR